ncbi:hypothetical protein HGRIS_002976 [Hohenbuehelia grisea]|uniref:Chromo domain-containing protein n=1 Tax=Hohenbuehelia grisea TaxID=104357 RepID=A0ABR3JM33_9AGAR
MPPFIHSSPEPVPNHKEYKVEKILDSRLRMYDGRTGYYVKWKNFGSEYNSWVDERDIRNAEQLIVDHELHKSYKVMNKYMHLDSWEELVYEIFAVYKVNSYDEDMTVIFSLISGEIARADLKVCKARFPQQMLEFYESHLDWKTGDLGEVNN